MPGETDLEVMLRTLEPVLDDVEYGFGTVPVGSTLPAGLRPLGTFAETEGLTVIAPAADLAAAGISHSAGFARISLTVHSALDAVGLTAAFSRRTREGWAQRQCGGRLLP